MHSRTLDIFRIVRVILARNLEIDPEAIDLEFKFHNFIDRLADRRQRQSGSKSLLYYIEAANIYIDLSEAFELNFLADFTDNACITVGDLIVLIKSKLDNSTSTSSV
jgi:sporulation-control protein spo0M